MTMLPSLRTTSPTLDACQTPIKESASWNPTSQVVLKRGPLRTTSYPTTDATVSLPKPTVPVEAPTSSKSAGLLPAKDIMADSNASIIPRDTSVFRGDVEESISEAALARAREADPNKGQRCLITNLAMPGFIKSCHVVGKFTSEVGVSSQE